MGAPAQVGAELVLLGLSAALMMAALKLRRQGGLFAALPWGLLPFLFMAGFEFSAINRPDPVVEKERNAWVSWFEQQVAKSGGKEQPPERMEEVRQVAVLTFELKPAADFCGRMLLLAAVAVLLRRRAQRQGWLSPAEPLLRWTAPVPLLWLVLSPVFLLMAARHGLLSLGLAQQHLALNVMAVGLAIYLFQGMVVFGAVLSRWFRDPRTRGLGPLVLVGMALLVLLRASYILMTMLVFMGLFEPWVDLRRLSFKADKEG